jgi:hypothetical protein
MQEELGRDETHMNALISRADPDLRSLAVRIAVRQDWDVVALGMAEALLQRQAWPAFATVARKDEWAAALEVRLHGLVERTFQGILSNSRSREHRWALTRAAHSSYHEHLSQEWASANVRDA